MIVFWASPTPLPRGSVGRTCPTLEFEANRVGRSDASDPKIFAALRAAGRSVGRVRPRAEQAKVSIWVGRSDASDQKIFAALRTTGRSVGTFVPKKNVAYILINGDT